MRYPVKTRKKHEAEKNDKFLHKLINNTPIQNTNSY